MWNKVLNLPHTSTGRQIAIMLLPLAFVLGSFALFETAISPMIREVAPKRMTVESLLEAAAQHRCIDGVLSKLDLQKVDFNLYQQVWVLCGNEGFNALSLEDLRIRREKFIRQEFDERVTLALVVAITISGVVMAGLQLFMSYRLAQSGQSDFGKDDTQLSIEKGKVAFKSSVVGLAILIISLAFFVVYVKWIYATNNDGAADAARNELPAARNQVSAPRQLPVNATLTPRQASGQRPKAAAPESPPSNPPPSVQSTAPPTTP